MSLDYPPGPVTSFLELYAQHKGFEHISLARAGATNFVIRLQIEEAIKNRADYVVVGCTSSDRFDIPLAVDDQTPWFELANVLYTGYSSASELVVSNGSVHVVSDTVVNILGSIHENLITEEQKLAIKHCVSYLHNHSLKRQENYYVISDGFRKLQLHGIPFVYVPHGMGHQDWSWVERVWPVEQLPCQMPKGPYDYKKSITHNDQECHYEFLEILKSITHDWT